MATHRVYKGKPGDQTLITIPHRGGLPVRVASATYAILDTRFGESSDEHVLVAAGTAATVDAASTVLTNRAGRYASDHRVITVSSTAGFARGHSYLLQAPAGQAELVTVDAVVSGTALHTASEIRGEFAIASTLRGVEVAASFPEEAANDDQKLDGMPWILVWTFPDGPPIRESIHLERGEEQQLASHADLVSLDPAIAKIGGETVDTALPLKQAHTRWRNDLTLAGANESDLLTGDIGQEAVTNLAAYYCFLSSTEGNDIDKREAYYKRYQELRAAVQVGAMKPHVVALDKSSETTVKTNPASLFRAFGF